MSPTALAARLVVSLREAFKAEQFSPSGREKVVHHQTWARAPAVQAGHGPGSVLSPFPMSSHGINAASL